MPGKRHSEEQIVYALRQVEAGKKVSAPGLLTLSRQFEPDASLIAREDEILRISLG